MIWRICWSYDNYGQDGSISYTSWSILDMKENPVLIDQDSIPSLKWISSETASRGAASCVPQTVDEIADIYNQAGDEYVAYADGDVSQLFAFDGIHGYADRYVWSILETKLVDLRASGASSVSLLDAGCGPGTWLRRLIARAHALGFRSITARGFDVAQSQIQRARLAAQDVFSLPGVDITFEVANMADRLREPDASVDFTLCLYSALSHLPVESLNDIAKEFARVTARYLITTVRPIGSIPTAFVGSVKQVSRLKQDHTKDRCEIDLCDGRRMGFTFHLFTAAELEHQFAGHFDVEDLRGLDLFHSRFMPDSAWNPISIDAIQIADELSRLENVYATKNGFIDRATHLLFVGRSRQSVARENGTAAWNVQKPPKFADPQETAPSDEDREPRL